ncbi:MAG TPA: tetratricopeptide repeat protein [Chthoniobacterales bacterium]|nr:tetratricopeptide repeat protein [Chthoniobacterales bacterium]
MNVARATAACCGLAVFLAFDHSSGQYQPPVRRAQPVEEPPIMRAQPADELYEPLPPRTPVEQARETPPPGTEGADRRQIEYANALFTRKLYDLAIPEYQKYLDEYSTGPGRANAYFSLGECYRNLNRPSNARTSFQNVLNDYPESEFAGPAAYALAEMAFSQKDYSTALPLFHRSAAKSKAPAVVLSARYFEARCLEALERKDEAYDIYQQVADVTPPNPYREDARRTAASIAFARGRKADALRHYEALANETDKPGLKAEASVRAGLIAVDLSQPEKGKIDKGMVDKAAALLQKGRALSEGRWRSLAQIGLLRLEYQSGQYAQVLADYKRALQQLPEDARPEIMLLAANSHRQLGHTKEAEALYQEIISKYSDREEGKEAGYQRLINIYNSDPSTLPPEVDEFLATNPTTERAEQAKLLKAEALYKQQNYQRAAPIYAELRAAQLSPKLRAECAYKLGWCYIQLKDTAGALEAFTYFVQAFPDNPQASAALAQRALVHQQAKDYDAALADWNTILTKYPGAREREDALHNKALILGQQQNLKGMADTFRQLLKEFPKTAAAAQAQYYIGKAAFELKDYKTALSALNTARQLNKEQYYDLATVRIISCYFGMHDRAAATKEVDAFLATDRNAVVPAEILEWLGIEYYNEKNYAAAEKYLALIGKIDNPQVKPDFWFYLGDAAAKQHRFDESEKAFEKYLATSTDPAGKAKVLLALGAVKIAAHKPDDAQKIAEEIMVLQPEGRVNAEARILAGDVQFERGRFEDAGKAFMGVALLYDDPAITPRALQKASLAYQRAGKSQEADRATRELREKYPNYAGG